jgi:hypothetical protein
MFNQGFNVSIPVRTAGAQSEKSMQRMKDEKGGGWRRLQSRTHHAENIALIQNTRYRYKGNDERVTRLHLYLTY